MRKTTLALSAILVAQVALATGIAVRHNLEQGRLPAKLLAFNAAAVDGLAIEETGAPALSLEKHDGKWVLPAVDNAPANTAQVVDLIQSLGKLEGGWPVATTAEAAKRFRVASDGFDHRIRITSGGKALGTLLLGTAPAYRLMNARVDGSDSVYTVAFNTTDTSSKPENWEDKTLLTLSPSDISKIELSDVTLLRDKDGWRAADLAAKEEMVADKTDALERELATPLYDAILGTAVKPDYGLDKPAVSVDITLKDGRQLHYDIGKMAQGDDYVLRSSGQTFLFRLPKYSVTPLLSANRAELVRHKGEANAATKDGEVVRTSGG